MWFHYISSKCSKISFSNSLLLSSFCKNNTLDPTLIQGKIVVCALESVTENRSEKGIFISQGGGVGIILIDSLVKEVGFQFVIPASTIGQEEAQDLEAYKTKEK